MRTATLDEVPGLKLAIGAPSRATGGRKYRDQG